MIIIVILAIFISILLGIQKIKVNDCIKQVSLKLQPWQNIKPHAAFKVLFAGDSTAVGTGLWDNSKSTAGLFSHDFPDIDLENVSRNGLRLKGLIDILKGLQDKTYDLAVLQIGANDIIQWTAFPEIKEEHARVLDLTRHIAQKIIILHYGDIGQSPLFIWPINWLFAWRSLKVRKIYMQVQNDRVAYLDIYALNKGKDFSDCYARDHLHLNEKGYAIWYGYIKDELLKRHWITR